MSKIRKKDALDYHSQGRPGKIEVIPTKPYSSQRDLSLAYSPGVAEPCLAIQEHPEDAYKYTAKGNLVAVISNGTAVLGLGNIGALASKPVMEGKGLLFKIFADIDVFDIEVDADDPEKFIETVKAISPTFGGINLEDIKAPEAFDIEKRLVEELDMPVMHDDQHGTAIISGAALLNALELTGKDIGKVRIVVNGAGSSAQSCTRIFKALGANPKNILMLDSKGVITTDRDNLDKHKAEFAVPPSNIKNLDDAMKGADVFLGLSIGGVVSKDMVKSMAKDPIVFALANPDPEISYKDATSVRDDIIMATGRSDTPNQVNNVLGFPYIFRGAMDVRAKSINMEMKLAAVRAIASLAKELVPEEVNEAYGEKNISFGRDSIIPKPLDHRLITYVAPAVAKAAIDSGVAQATISDWDEYKAHLLKRLGLDNKLIKSITQRASRNPKRVVFPEADNYKILKAAQIAVDEQCITPILLGRADRIHELIEENQLEDLEGAVIIDPKGDDQQEKREEFAHVFFEKRKRKGVTFENAVKLMRERNYFGAMMVELNEADALVSGITRHYSQVLKPAIEIVGMQEGVDKVAGMHILITKRGPIFLADTTVNYDPTAQELADITALVAKTVQSLKVQPRIAFLSYSNFGSSRGADAEKMRDAVKIVNEQNPELIADGEVQADFALDNELMLEKFAFSSIANKKVNTLIFPNLSASNIAYKLLGSMTDSELIGPLVLGTKKPIHVLQLGSSVREIVNVVKLAVVHAQRRN